MNLNPRVNYGIESYRHVRSKAVENLVPILSTSCINAGSHISYEAVSPDHIGRASMNVTHASAGDSILNFTHLFLELLDTLGQLGNLMQLQSSVEIRMVVKTHLYLTLSILLHDTRICVHVHVKPST